MTGGIELSIWIIDKKKYTYSVKIVLMIYIDNLILSYNAKKKKILNMEAGHH